MVAPKETMASFTGKVPIWIAWMDCTLQHLAREIMLLTIGETERKPYLRDSVAEINSDRPKLGKAVISPDSVFLPGRVPMKNIEVTSIFLKSLCNINRIKNTIYLQLIAYIKF